MSLASAFATGLCAASAMGLLWLALSWGRRPSPLSDSAERLAKEKDASHRH